MSDDTKDEWVNPNVQKFGESESAEKTACVMFGASCGESVIRYGPECAIRQGHNCALRNGSACESVRFGANCAVRTGTFCMDRNGPPCDN